jgi:hypothetical protein
LAGRRRGAGLYADVLDMHAEALGANTTPGPLDLELALSPLVSDVILGQLVDGRLRVRALDLVRSFAEEIPQIVGKPELAEHAERALKMVDKVEQVAKGEPKERVEAARELAAELVSIISAL